MRFDTVLVVVLLIGFTEIATACVGAAKLGQAINAVTKTVLKKVINFITKTPYAAQANDLIYKCQIGLRTWLGSVMPNDLLGCAVIFHFHGHASDYVRLISEGFEVKSGVPVVTF